MSSQVCVVRIAGYGPWTLGLGSDREHRLQALQATLYATLQGAFSERGGLVFQNRADELFALTNGMDMPAHEAAMGEVAPRFGEVDLRAAVGCAAGPLAASRAAHAASLAAGEARTCGEACAGGAGEATVLHMDVDGLSARRRESSPFEISASIYSLYADMARFYLARGGLAFFMGGDNFMVVPDGDAAAVRRDASELVASSVRLGLGLNCGIGRGATARGAAAAATRSLDEIRRLREGGTAERVHEAP